MRVIVFGAERHPQHVRAIERLCPDAQPNTKWTSSKSFPGAISMTNQSDDSSGVVRADPVSPSAASSDSSFQQTNEQNVMALTQDAAICRLRQLALEARSVWDSAAMSSSIRSINTSDENCDVVTVDDARSDDILIVEARWLILDGCDSVHATLDSAVHSALMEIDGANSIPRATIGIEADDDASMSLEQNELRHQSFTMRAKQRVGRLVVAVAVSLRVGAPVRVFHTVIHGSVAVAETNGADASSPDPPAFAVATASLFKIHSSDNAFVALNRDLGDGAFVPEGFGGKTLAQLGEHLGLQTAPYLELADSIRSREFRGTMEIHIFVAPINPNEEIQARFKEVCGKVSGMKCCNLRLKFLEELGGWTCVLMSSRYVVGNMDYVWRETFKDARYLARAGFDVIRTKVEATASITGVPVTNDDALCLPAKTYFEFHMVWHREDMEQATEDDILRVSAIANKAQQEWDICIPLSQNCFQTTQFLNMRTYKIGRENAFPKLEELAERVRAAGYVVPRKIREFGVYDTDVTVDAGWLEPLDATVGQGARAGFLKPLVATRVSSN